MWSRSTRISAATSSATARVGQIRRAARSIASLRMPPRSPARSVQPRVLLADEVVDGDDHRHARVQQRAVDPRRVEEIVAAPRLAPLDDLATVALCHRSQPAEQAARVAADAARVRRRPASTSSCTATPCCLKATVPRCRGPCSSAGLKGRGGGRRRRRSPGRRRGPGRTAHPGPGHVAGPLVEVAEHVEQAQVVVLADGLDPRAAGSTSAMARAQLAPVGEGAGVARCAPRRRARPTATPRAARATAPRPRRSARGRGSSRPGPGAARSSRSARGTPRAPWRPRTTCPSR